MIPADGGRVADLNFDKNEIVRLSEEYGAAWGLNHTRRLLRLIELIGAGDRVQSRRRLGCGVLRKLGCVTRLGRKRVWITPVRSTQVADTFLTGRRLSRRFQNRTSSMY